ncbi:hypothetical protein [Streptomyces torulosus]|uniref:hypothetical protein n=1 Tax=Streptomyces torulosus TaxID=68276 RepID=UPI0012FEED47|nr:hypothetical protein [Streptomyces torulosus]
MVRDYGSPNSRPPYGLSGFSAGAPWRRDNYGPPEKPPAIGSCGITAPGMTALGIAEGGNTTVGNTTLGNTAPA